MAQKHQQTASSTKRRIWSKQDLTIAYYLTRYEYKDLTVSKAEIVRYILGNTTSNSLEMQISGFRYLLQQTGVYLTTNSKAKRDLVNEFRGKGRLYVLEKVQQIIRDKYFIQEELAF